MKTIVGITLRGAGLALALTSVQAGAQPVEQTTKATAAAQAAPAGLTRQAFLKRHAERLLARDTDGDGMVSHAEFLAAGSKQGTARRFATLDRNADGLLDTAEIDAMLTRRFARMDGNGDNVLSSEERAAMRARKGKPARDATAP
jgi:hypothetical protein